jgi:hypothetical protein
MTYRWEIDNNLENTSDTNLSFKSIISPMSNIDYDSSEYGISSQSDIIYTDLQQILEQDSSFTLDVTLSDSLVDTSVAQNYFTLGYHIRGSENTCLTVGRDVGSSNVCFGTITKFSTMKKLPIASILDSEIIQNQPYKYTLVVNNVGVGDKRIRLWQKNVSDATSPILICESSDDFPKMNIVHKKLFIGSSMWTNEPSQKNIFDFSKITLKDDIILHVNKTIDPFLFGDEIPNNISISVSREGVPIYNNIAKPGYLISVSFSSNRSIIPQHIKVKLEQSDDFPFELELFSVVVLLIDSKTYTFNRSLPIPDIGVDLEGVYSSIRVDFNGTIWVESITNIITDNIYITSDNVAPLVTIRSLNYSDNSEPQIDFNLFHDGFSNLSIGLFSNIETDTIIDDFLTLSNIDTRIPGDLSGVFSNYYNFDDGVFQLYSVCANETYTLYVYAVDSNDNSSYVRSNITTYTESTNHILENPKFFFGGAFMHIIFQKIEDTDDHRDLSDISAYDHSGNNNHADLAVGSNVEDNLTISPGSVNMYALKLVDEEIVTLSPMESVFESDGFTICTCFKLNHSNNSINLTDNQPGLNFDLNILNDQINLTYYSHGNTVTSSNSPSPTHIDEWHSLVLTRQDNNVLIYLDTVELDLYPLIGDFQIPLSIESVMITGSNLITDPFVYLDDVRVYKYVISKEQIDNISTLFSKQIELGFENITGMANDITNAIDYSNVIHHSNSPYTEPIFTQDAVVGNRALRFNSTNETSLEILNSLSYGDLTFSCWLKIPNSNTDNPLMTFSNNNTFQVGIDSNGFVYVENNNPVIP